MNYSLPPEILMATHDNAHPDWTVDLEACTATHASGLVVRAVRSPDDDATDFHPANLDAWQDKMLQSMPLDALIQLAKRLMREAVTAYRDTQADRH